MITPVENKLLSMNLRSFPVMAAASAAIKQCPTCPHKKANKEMVLHAAAMRMQNNKAFKDFLKQNIGLPVMIGGILFEE